MLAPRLRLIIKSVILSGFLFAVVLTPQHCEVEAAATYTVTNTADSGSGSLRWAINTANFYSGQDMIEFSIPTSDGGYQPGTGQFHITLLSELPILTDPAGVIIDGATQAANMGDTNPLGPEIEIVVQSSIDTVFRLGGGNNTIAGLSIAGSDETHIDIFFDNNTIIDNYIGLEARGLMCSDFGRSIGIRNMGSNNTIQHNIIACTRDAAIMLNSPGSLNQIIDNVIGLDVEKTIIGNLSNPLFGNTGYGVAIYNSNTNIIKENLISHNAMSGIVVNNGKWNTIDGNCIGLNGAGNSGSGNSYVGNTEFGIWLQDNSIQNIVKNNVVAGNGRTGIYLTGTNNKWNEVYANIVGANWDYVIMPNGEDGIGIHAGSHENTIGSIAVPEWKNLIFGNGGSGIVVFNSQIGKNVIANNLIGAFQNLENHGNNLHGVIILNSPDNLITQNEIANNGVITPSAGVLIDGLSAIHNSIFENSIYKNKNFGIQLLNSGNQNISPPQILNADNHSVNGTACPGCLVEIFSDQSSQGEIYEGDTIADAVGTFSFTGDFHGPNITATQTDLSDNTSQFSTPYEINLSTFLPLIMK